MKTNVIAAMGLFTVCCLGGEITGNWRLNVEKSRGVPLSAQKMKVEKAGSTYHISGENTLASGKTVPFKFARICDGKEHPLEGEGISPGTVETCDPESLTITGKTAKGGTMQVKVSFSPDGNTHMLNVKSTTPAGKESEQMWVYERQQ